MLGPVRGFTRQTGEHRQEKALRFTRPGTSCDDDARAASIGLRGEFECLRLMLIGRIEQELLRLPRRHTG